MIRSHSIKRKYCLGLAVLALCIATTAWSDTFEVTITNMTVGESFTPRLAFTHSTGHLFTVGEPAIDEVATIAESGTPDPAVALLESAPEVVKDIVVMAGLLAPGGTEQIMIEGDIGDKLTVINMLIPSNDAFMALDAVYLPESGSITFDALIYDAGSEPNDELCANIPGPTCGGEGDSPDTDGEGFIHIHNGIHGVGDLAAAAYDWRNPGARITITKVN